MVVVAGLMVEKSVVVLVAVAVVGLVGKLSVMIFDGLLLQEKT